MTIVSLNLQTVFHNVDVAQNIVGYMNYKDQLSMARVCRQFEDVIINFVWKAKYKHVEMFMKEEDDVRVISNFTDDNFDDLLNDDYQLKENRIIFQQEELIEFLNLNAFNIEHFYIVGSDSYTSSGYFYFKFPNIKSLMYYGITLSDKVLEVVAENCPKLEKLVLNSCTNSDNKHIILGKDISFATIDRMRHLKSLTIKERKSPGGFGTRAIRYEHIEERLYKLKLKQLYIHESIFPPRCTAPVPCKKKKSYYKQAKPNFYEELEIGKFHSTDDFVKFYTTFLAKYTNLSKLSIVAYREHCIRTSEHCIPKKFFRIINKSCRKLESLTIKESKISNFIPTPTITELNLIECKGLSWLNFKQILGDMNLTTFRTERTFYSGTSTPFAVASTLRHLEIDLPQRYFNEILKGQFKHVTYLKWHSTRGNSVANLPVNFPNLEKLIVHQMDSADNILNMSQLSCVMVLYHLNFKDVLKLLQHGALKELTFGSFRRKTDEDVEPKAMILSNLRFIRMLETSLLEHIEFWFDMLLLNSNLSLAIDISLKSCIENEVFQKLASNTQIMQRLKSLKICGFNIGK